MGCHNSLVFYNTLFRRLLLDIADCYTESDATRDWTKIQARVAAEGLSFYTKTLPKLGKAFDKALQGRSPLLSEGFSRIPGTVLPKLFGWLLRRVLSDSGDVRGDADIQAIKHARQLLYFMYKLTVPYDSKSTQKVIESFVDVENELLEFVIPTPDIVVEFAAKLLGRVLSGSCPRDILPRHGPGAVSTGERGGEKSHFSRLYTSLESYYPFTDYMHLSVSQTVDSLEQLEDLEVLSHGTAKVVLVPKDSRGPRLISCEPLELQWIQQGQQRKLYDIVENHRLTRGRVNFRDQSVNRSMALSASLSQEWVTLDMKDASDRVSLELVSKLFDRTGWFEALCASRSSATRLPNGRVVAMKKFAPMGSAVCFPVEALCFYSLAISMLVVYKNYTWQNALRRIFVYGDDIICHRDDYPVLLEHFPRYALRFNEDKCCVSGFFRESCGCDAYKGVDITPIRLRTQWSHRVQTDARTLTSYVALSNALYERGYRRAGSYIQLEIERLYGYQPYVEYKVEKKKHSHVSITPPGRVIGWYRPEVIPLIANKQRGLAHRWNNDLHYHEVRGYSSKPVYNKYRIKGWEACLRTLTSGSTGMQPGIYAVAHRSRLQCTWGRYT